MTTAKWPQWTVAVLAMALPLCFAAFTNHAWEDYFITLRASRNLVLGHGLVFNPGERVHTFTSPLGVLLPAAALRIAGTDHPIGALWLFRGLSAAALAAAAGLVWQRLAALRVGPTGRWLFFGLLLCDAKLTDFAINGMETGILVALVLWLWCELERPGGARALPLGFAIGGLMWTRPDAFTLIGALCLPQLLFRSEPRPSRPWGTWVRGVLLGGLLYLPWLLWAWHYYGSPIPHTILAKAQITPPLNWQSLLTVPWRTLTGKSLAPDLFLPSYFAYGGWPAALQVFAGVLVALAAFSWLLPALPGPARRASFSFFCGLFYVCSIVLFPWYSPPWAAIAGLALALSADALSATLARRAPEWCRAALRIGIATVVAIQVAMWLAVAWEMRVQQRVIEDTVRHPIGDYLRDNSQPGDSVFLEPLGYIGYYSNLKTYDYPGLSSPEVVAAIKRGSRRFAEVVATVQPTWLVLRPWELADPARPENAFLRRYRLVRSWDARADLDAVEILPGRGWVGYDAQYNVFRRIDEK